MRSFKNICLFLGRRRFIAESALLGAPVFAASLGLLTK